MALNIYRVWQDEIAGFDTFDAMVVIAVDEDDARRIHPGHQTIEAETFQSWTLEQFTGERWDLLPTPSWAGEVDVHVELVGVASPGLKRGCVLLSHRGD